MPLDLSKKRGISTSENPRMAIKLHRVALRSLFVVAESWCLREIAGLNIHCPQTNLLLVPRSLKTNRVQAQHISKGYSRLSGFLPSEGLLCLVCLGLMQGSLSKGNASAS